MSFFTVLILLATASVGTSSSCVKLAPTSQADGLNLACLGVVDYSYYLPTNLESSALNTIAKDQLADSRLAILPVGCQIALKKLVCSNIYRKCPDKIVLNDTTTFKGWNFNIYTDVTKTLPVPFQRPCVQVSYPLFLLSYQNQID